MDRDSRARRERGSASIVAVSARSSTHVSSFRLGALERSWVMGAMLDVLTSRAWNSNVDSMVTLSSAVARLYIAGHDRFLNSNRTCFQRFA